MVTAITAASDDGMPGRCAQQGSIDPATPARRWAPARPVRDEGADGGEGHQHVGSSGWQAEGVRYLLEPMTTAMPTVNPSTTGAGM